MCSYTRSRTHKMRSLNDESVKYIELKQENKRFQETANEMSVLSDWLAGLPAASLHLYNLKVYFCVFFWLFFTQKNYTNHSFTKKKNATNRYVLSLYSWIIENYYTHRCRWLFLFVLKVHPKYTLYAQFEAMTKKRKVQYSLGSERISKRLKYH